MYLETTQNTDDENEFNFVVQADIHMDKDTDVLTNTIENINSVSPEFILDLGDTLMLGEYGETDTEALERISLVNSYFSLFDDIPICLVNGNHDGENGFRSQLMEKSQKLRNEYYPMPFQNLNSFSGDVKNANYYSFEKENALFIVLDPFTFTTNSSAGWEDTLGIEQYNWLENVLSNSNDKFKFVFIHNITGGIDTEHRGGVAAASMYEWGGNNSVGTDEFSSQRPDFTMPIHDLLVKYNVTAVFHGHDHFYASE